MTAAMPRSARHATVLHATLFVTFSTEPWDVFSCGGLLWSHGKCLMGVCLWFGPRDDWVHDASP